MEYRRLNLPSGDYISIKFDTEGVVYDMFDRNDELLEEFGYDFYHEIDNINILIKEKLKDE